LLVFSCLKIREVDLTRKEKETSKYLTYSHKRVYIERKKKEKEFSPSDFTGQQTD